jgi:hypothetical protein
LIEILKSIRYFTKIQTTLDAGLSNSGANDYRAACFGIQPLLELLRSKTTLLSQSLEDGCTLVAYIFIDLVLLHTCAEAVITGNMNGPLQGVMIYLSNKRQQKENDDILL